MNYTSISTPFVKGLATLGMLLTAGAMTSFANINVTKTLPEVDMQAPASLKVSSEAVAVNGTGAVTFKFDFVVDNGCCMRVQAQLMRQASLITKLGQSLPGLPTVITSKTFELCGSLSGQSLTTTVDTTSDNANFFVVFTNLDSWDKAHVTMSNMKATFPIPVFIIPVHDGNLPLTIQAGDVNDTRTFTLSPVDSTGKANLSLSWTNNTQLSVTITRPDGTLVPNPAGGTAFKSDAGKSNLSIPNIAVSAANSSAGNLWTITMTNLSSVASTGITIGGTYTVNE